MHDQRPHPHVQRQPRDRVGEGEPAAHVHARARLGVAAVPAQTHLDARRQRHPAAAEGVAPRALQRRAHARHPGLGGVQASHRAIKQVTGRADPQRVGLERQREPAGGPRADQIAPRPHRRHRHRHARLHRRLAGRRQAQPAAAVAGHPPHRHPVVDLVAHPRVEPGHRRRHLPGARVAPVATRNGVHPRVRGAACGTSFPRRSGGGPSPRARGSPPAHVALGASSILGT